jgi:3',5'-cyclic AMP phosphodiesterase CpdA
MKKHYNRRKFIEKTTIASGLSFLFANRTRPEGNNRGRVVQSPLPVRFAIASDGHFGQPDTDYERFHSEMTEWLNFEARLRGLDFVVFNGDLIHDQPEFLPLVKDRFSKLQIPYYAVKGNHDKVTASVWEQTWGYGQNHGFAKGDYAFLLGTTSNENGDYLCADLDWFKAELKKYADKKGIFVFLHICQHSFTRHGISCPEINNLLESTQNVAAVFHGHDHDMDNVVYSNGRAYFFDGHMGGSWGTNYRGYRIVEIAPDGGIGTYQCNPAAYFVNRSRIG